MIDDAVQQLLVTTPGITALVGTNVFPLVLPDTVQTGVTYKLVSDVETQTLNNGVVFATARLQFECWSPTLLAAKAMAKAIHAVLNEYSGTLSTGDTVSNAWRAAQDTFFEPDLRLYRVQVDWMLIYSPAS